MQFQARDFPKTSPAIRKKNRTQNTGPWANLAPDEPQTASHSVLVDNESAAESRNHGRDARITLKERLKTELSLLSRHQTETPDVHRLLPV
jgi:hypothetical protein